MSGATAHKFTCGYFFTQAAAQDGNYLRRDAGHQITLKYPYPDRAIPSCLGALCMYLPGMYYVHAPIHLIRLKRISDFSLGFLFFHILCLYATRWVMTDLSLGFASISSYSLSIVPRQGMLSQPTKVHQQSLTSPGSLISIKSSHLYLRKKAKAKITLPTEC